MSTFADHYENRGYPRRYGEQIDRLIDWWRERIKDHSPIVVTEQERNAGIDSFPEDIRDMSQLAFNQWLQGGYELSYNQMNVAFFQAANDCGIITTIPA